MKKDHLKMIQKVIARMGSNSFLLKGWSVTLVSALFAIAGRDANKNLVYVTFIPVVTFWILDAYFLREERSFRRLYDKVRILDEEQIDFSMNPYDPQSGQGRIIPFWNPLLLAFYGALIAFILILKYFIN
jgi:hypothetical protein